MLEYAALVISPRALPDDLILVFQHPAKRPDSVSQASANDIRPGIKIIDPL